MERTACLISLLFALSACVTGQSPSAPGPAGFGVTAGEVRGALPLDRFAQTAAAPDDTRKTPTSGREVAPMQVAATTVVTGGVGSFNRFQAGFLDAVAADRRTDYLDDILFPLTLIDYRRPDRNGRTVSLSRFASHLVYDQTTLSRSNLPPVSLGDAFTGRGSEAVYWGDRLLVFRPVEGRWMLTEAGSCDDVSCTPADLLCRGFDPRRAFPGRTPHGYEDFGAFYQAFYCMGDALLEPAEASPAGSAIASRIRFPLAALAEEPTTDAEAVTDAAVEAATPDPVQIGIDEFQPAMLFPSRRAVPQVTVDGTEARAVVGIEDGHRVTATFSRIEGLWYLTGLSV